MQFKKLINFINNHDKFIICGHESPDGDSVGSGFALLQALKKIGKTATVINTDPTPHNFKFVDVDNEIDYFKSENQLPKDISEYVLLIIDTNDINNIGVIKESILPKIKKLFIIDHHENSGDLSSGNLIYSDASSTAEILYQLIKKMKIEIDLPMAKSLYMAIVYDTGSFIYPKTSSITLKIAYELVKIGVNPNEIYANVYENNSISSIVLQSKVLATLELEYDNQVAIQTMLKDIIIECKAIYEEEQHIINLPLKAKKIRVSIFFKEDTEGILRCSLRSKGNIDVCKIAHFFGGGGHKTAAGFKFKISLKEMRQKVLKELEPYFK